MLRLGDNQWQKLSTNLAQVWSLCAVSTGRLCNKILQGFLYGLKRTAYAQARSLFTQLKTGVFNLLGSSLYTVSTGPITNTKYIKEIHL